MLGTEFSPFFEERVVPCTGTDREVDVTDPRPRFLPGTGVSVGKPVGWIVNCAAYTQWTGWRTRYVELAQQQKNMIFGGRLGMYQYFDTDDTITSVLNTARKLL